MSDGVAVVTGGARNLGRTIAHTLAARGLHVVVNTRADVAAAQSVVAEIRAGGGSAEPVIADVTDPAAVSAMFETAQAAGPLRALVNNAALRSRAPVDQIDDHEWRRVMATTLDSAWYCVQAALPGLREAGGGAVVNILGANALAGDPTRVHVSAAKHAVLGLTLGLAEALRADGITVNGVSPGAMAVDGVTLEEARVWIADTVAWLTAPEARSVTGQILHVKGLDRERPVL